MTQHRYYIGLSLPPTVHERIASTQAKLFDPSTVIQPLDPHITLLPPPSVEKISPAVLASQVQQIAANYLPITFTLQDIAMFDKQTIVLRVEGHSLYNMQSKLAKLVSRDEQSARAVNRPFRPHVTLNQAIRGSRIPQALAQAYHKELADILPQVCTMSHLTLYKWFKPRTYRAEQI